MLTAPDELIREFGIFTELQSAEDYDDCAVVAASRLARLAPDDKQRVVVFIRDVLALDVPADWAKAIRPLEDRANTVWHDEGGAEDLRRALATILDQLNAIEGDQSPE
jgi:hypothetical protein